MQQCIKFVLFWSDTLDVSDGLYDHRQEFKTSHTATKRYCCLLASRQQYLFDICLLLYVQSCSRDDGRKELSKLQNKINLIH